MLYQSTHPQPRSQSWGQYLRQIVSGDKGLTAGLNIDSCRDIFQQLSEMTIAIDRQSDRENYYENDYWDYRGNFGEVLSRSTRWASLTPKFVDVLCPLNSSFRSVMHVNLGAGSADLSVDSTPVGDM